LFAILKIVDNLGGFLSSIRVLKHDRLQLEIKTTYDYQPQKKQGFLVDMWFYLPVATGISASDYNSEDFYNDLRTYTRLKTPVFPLQGLLDNPNSPLYLLGELVSQKRKEINQKTLRREMKMLSCIFRQSLKAEWGAIENEKKVLDDLPILITIKDNWRQAVEVIEKKNYKKKTKECMRFIDQAFSNQLEVIGLHILETFTDKELSCRDEIVSIVNEELQYRKKRGYPTHSFDKTDFEQYLIYQSNLKKFTTSVLFLNSRSDKLTGLVRHIALGIAAGLAMAWAIMAQIYALIHYGVNLNEGMNRSLIVLFTMIGIFSYIMKDRIKATSAVWLSKKLSNWFHDRKFIYSMPEEKDSIATISEHMKFITTDEGSEDLQSKWREMEKKKLSFIIGGDVLHYNREILVRSTEAKRCFNRFQGIVDIHRINVWRWIKTFSDPQKEITFLNHDNAIEKKKVKRIYEVDMVARFINGNQEEWTLVKILLNRRGIISVQEVN
jgi:hypothetical protein